MNALKDRRPEQGLLPVSSSFGSVRSYLGLASVSKSELLFCFLCLIAGIALIFFPTGFEGAYQREGKAIKAKVIEVDDSQRHVIGFANTGEQIVTIEVLRGSRKGEIFRAFNHFLGKLDLDKVYKEGEKVFVILGETTDGAVDASIIDRYRLNTQAILLIVFFLFLLSYAGWVGLKAIVSFFFTTIVIWKVMLPGFLKGFAPIFFSTGIVALLTAVIIFLVAGFTRKGFVAFLGAFSGVLLTCLLAVGFGKAFAIPGEIKPFSETLLYTGFYYLNLSNIFLAGIFIASSGAVMDIAMDVAASMDEIAVRNPSLGRLDLIRSGFTVGRSVIGTMTTTLLLAYSGGYSTLLMVFIAQGVPVANILNIQYVSAEILHTLVGSFGLVLVAPATAIIGGVMLRRASRSALTAE